MGYELSLGPYRTLNCGENSTHIGELLYTLQNYLQPVLDDLFLDPASDAYMTFFKHVSYVESVKDVLTGVATGRPYLGPQAGRWESSGGKGALGSPVFICPTAPDQ